MKRNTFEGWQESNQTRREELIKEYLIYLGKTRVRVRNITDLADLVARHIAHEEAAPCNKSTLLRNTRYKARLLTYQAKHSSLEERALDARSVSDPIAKALLATSSLAHVNLNREVARLNIYIQSLESEIERLKQLGKGKALALPIPAQDSRTDSCVSRDEFKFIRTCQALFAVLQHLKSIVEVDGNNQQILDRTRRRDNVIVDKEVASAFFDWLASAPGRLE